MAGDNPSRCEVSSLLTRPALTINGDARDVFGEAGSECGVATHVECLLSDLRHAAPEHVVDDGGVDTGTGDQTLEHEGREVNRVNSAQGALLGLAHAHGRANGSDDDSVARGHGSSEGDGV